MTLLLTPEPSVLTLIELFNRTFAETENTLLQGSAEEPLYQPADKDDGCHCIYFTRDYFASALHEVAHWCVAGAGRRKLVDYGYWYAPDGRSASQQTEFEQVEVRPQALEWIFATAAGVGFRVSADNLAAGLGASEKFKTAIYAEVQRCCEQGLSPRATQFVQALLDNYQPSARVSVWLQAGLFRREDL